MIRWKLSRWEASASASTALMTSPWLHASHTDCGPQAAAMRASWRRIAATARACIPARPSPSGNTAAEGWACTTFQSGSFASVLSEPPVQLP